jgi:hypothetical protein
MTTGGRLTVSALCAWFLLSAGLASGASSDQQKCINALNKNLAKVASTTGKEYNSCIKNKAKGAGGVTDVEACVAADGKGKIGKATAKTVSDETKNCAADPPTFGATDAATVNQLALDKEAALMAVIFGSDIDASLALEAVEKDRSKCQQAIAKDLTKCQDTQLKEFNKCKKTVLKAGADTALELEACVLDDPAGKIAKKCDLDSGGKVDKIRKDLSGKCDAKGVDLALAFPVCGVAGDVAATHACLNTVLRCLTCTALNEADDLDRFCDGLDDGVANQSCDSGFANAMARLITDSADLIDGPLARGRLGDYLLANDKIHVIVQKLQRDAGPAFTQFGGQIIDADLRRAPGDPGQDRLEEWALMINIENTAHYTNVAVLNDGSDGLPAVIRATGPDDLLDWWNASSQVEELGASLGLTLPPEVDDRDLPVEVTTDYILGRGDDFVRVESTITNTDPNGIRLFAGGLLNSMAQEIFHPGYGFGDPTVTTEAPCAAQEDVFPCDFVAYSGEGDIGGVSYGYIHTSTNPATTSFNQSGISVLLFEADVLLALIGVQAPNFTLGPGESVQFTWYLAIGDGDVASVLDIRNRLKGLATGTVRGQVTAGGVPVPDAEVAVIGEPADGLGTSLNVLSAFRTDANGNYEGTLPELSDPGKEYELRVHKEGYLFASPDPANISVTAGGTVTQDFTFAEPGRVRVTIADPNGAPLAAKVSVVGFDPSTDPGVTQTVFAVIDNLTGVFGDITKDSLSHGIARIVFVDHTGDSGEFPLEPGDYRIVVSHGPEFSAHAEDITVASGGSVLVEAEVAHVVDTQGFVSGDFHVHSYDTFDCRITRKERIISMLAEGVDFFTPSDHGLRTDFTQDLVDLGVGDLISTAVNNEITSPDYGHFNAFPMTIDPNRVSGGAIDWGREAPPGQDFPSLGAFCKTPAEIFVEAKSDPGEETVQINHVHSFFDVLGLRLDTGVVPPQSTRSPSDVRLDPSIPNLWDDGFTALEIWIETGIREQIFENFLGQNAGNWFNLMNQGIVRTGVSDSDTHQVFLIQSGFPRNMIASPTDDPGALAAIAETLAINVNEGRNLGTNGPFMRVTLEGDPNEVGGHALGLPMLVRATGGSATVNVNVQSPTWAEFDTVEYYLNSATIADPNDRDGLPPLYRICPDVVQTDGVDFTVNTVMVGGHERLETSTSLALSGLTEDTWVVVMVKGTEDVSCPLFPVIPNELDPNANVTLADLKTCAPGDMGIPALAFSNPLFIDVDGNDVYDPPGLQFQLSCP